MLIQCPTKYSNAPIGWLGGKTKLAPTIVACIPKHVCYIEVFSGSASVFFYKNPNISRIEIINDIHGELVNLMKVISGTYFDDSIRQEFISYVRNMPASRDAYEDWKSWDSEQISKLNIAQRAFRFYYCVKKGFSSVPGGGYEASPKTNSRYNMKTDFDHFTQRFRSRNAQIENLDFSTLIEKYNRPESECFFFLDPPYFVANNTNYYEFVFKDDDHLRLKSDCDQIHSNKNKFLITYDNVPDVIDLYKEYFLYTTDIVTYSASDERGERELKKTEIFISNYDIVKMLDNKKKNIKTGDIFNCSSHDSRIDIDGKIGLTRIN